MKRPSNTQRTADLQAHKAVATSPDDQAPDEHCIRIDPIADVHPQAGEDGFLGPLNLWPLRQAALQVRDHLLHTPLRQAWGGWRRGEGGQAERQLRKKCWRLILARVILGRRAGFNIVVWLHNRGKLGRGSLCLRR